MIIQNFQFQCHSPKSKDCSIHQCLFCCLVYWGINETSRQSRLDARYWMLGAAALGLPRGMVQGGRMEEGSGWGTCVYLWRIHVDIWQNQYNIVKLKKKKTSSLRNRVTDVDNKVMVTRGEKVGGGINWEIGDIYTLLYIK